MSVSLRGNVEDFGIAEVFQLIGQQRKTGVLAFASGRQQVELVFDRGSVVSAAPAGSRPHEALGEMLVRCGHLTRERVAELHRECAASAESLPRRAVSRRWIAAEAMESIEDLLTRETIFQVLRWQSGSFDFQTREVEHGRPLETLLGAEQILMDGLRMVDEWQSFADLVPSEEGVLRQVASPEQLRQAFGAGEGREAGAAERVFRLVNGRISVRRVIDLSMLGTFEATRLLAELRRAGLVEPVKAPARARTRVSRTRSGRGLQVALGAVLPLLALLALAAWANRPMPVPTAAPGLEIEHDALEALRSAHRVRRLRNALDAFRLMEGRWPESLDEIQARGPWGGAPLATVPGRPYYYAQRDGQALLLAPER